MPSKKYTRWMRIRLLSVAALLTVLAVVVLVRFWTLQVSQSDWLKELAEAQYLKKISLEPMRGAIVDRNLTPMAVSIMTDSVFAMPGEIQDREMTVRELARVLGMPKAKLRKKLRRKHFTWIKRRLPPDESSRLKKLDLPGVFMRKESRRYYPAKDLAASVVGFAGDGRGLEGLELLFDGKLRGDTVLARGLRDAKGNILFSDGFRVKDESEDTRLVSTLDLTIEEIVDGELHRVVKETGARMAMAIVMDPNTGEILAMANVPSFNPNTYWKFSQASYRNRIVADCFEPGSTMKVFSLSTALDLGVTKPAKIYDCGSGAIRVGPHIIHDSGHHGKGLVSLRNVLVQSRNTCTAMIALDMGAERLWDGLNSFGFGRKTGVELPGESHCRLRKASKWYDVDLATIAFGQGVSVSALQLASALSAVANGGVWMKPRIVREIKGSGAGGVQGFAPQPEGRVIKPDTVRIMKDMMVGVTHKGGTGVRAAIPGFEVAGKTGTAQKPDPIAGGYSKDKRVASFIGFVPADKPRLTIVVVVDEPKSSPYGGVVAAPVFARIAEATLAYLGVYPKEQDLKNSNITDMLAQAEKNPVDAEEGAGLDDSASVNLTAKVGTPAGKGLMPDVRGHSAREAIEQLTPNGYEVVLKGSGRVKSQAPKPGVQMRPGAIVNLVLEDRS